jgi:ribonuclease HI
MDVFYRKGNGTRNMKQSFISQFFSSNSAKKITPIINPLKTVEIEPLLQYDHCYRMHFDGCSKGNPGPAGAGAVIYENFKNDLYEIWADSCYVGDKATNNESEYTGLLFGMKEALRRGIQKIDVYGDSEVVIKQMRGEYKVKSPTLKILYDEAKSIEAQIIDVKYIHVYRNKNTRADELSNLGLLKKP